MEVVLPVAIGVGAALAAAGALVLLRAVRSRIQERQERSLEIARIAAWPVAPWPVAPAARSITRKPRRRPAPVMDPPIGPGPVAPPRSRKSRAARSTAKTEADSERAEVVRVDDHVDWDVQGHADGDKDADAPTMDPVNIYWRTDGSTDCAVCASSRLRGARFCVRCGRRLA